MAPSVARASGLWGGPTRGRAEHDRKRGAPPLRERAPGLCPPDLAPTWSSPVFAGTASLRREAYGPLGTSQAHGTLCEHAGMNSRSPVRFCAPARETKEPSTPAETPLPRTRVPRLRAGTDGTSNPRDDGDGDGRREDDEGPLLPPEALSGPAADTPVHERTLDRTSSDPQVQTPLPRKK